MFEQKQTLGEVEVVDIWGRIRLFTSKHLFDYITIKGYAFTNARAHLYCIIFVFDQASNL